MDRGFFLSILLLLFFPLYIAADEQFSYIGMTLDELFERFGTPKTVASARGNELWQDDVVFQYASGDFYIHRDRVWQVKLASVLGITGRDRKASVLLALGNTAEDKGDHVLFPVTGQSWPLMLRINFNSAGVVSAFYVYRPDF